MTKCEIIQDLLPLYADGVCSAQSKDLIEEHIKSCDTCKDELSKMQSGEIRVRLRENSDAKIGVMKSIKRKLLKKNVIVALTACVAALIIALVGVWHVFFNDKPIEYEAGKFRAEINNDGFYVSLDGTTETQTHAITFLDIVSQKDFHRSYCTSRVMNVNGADTEIVYVYFTETVATRRWPKNVGERHHQQIGASEDGLIIYMPFGRAEIGKSYRPFPLEVYYLVAPLDTVNSMSDDDFYALREKGVLLWSGSLVDE